MNEKEKALAEILEIVAGAGNDPEAFKQKLDAVINIKDDSQTTDEDTEESKAFAEGVEYGEEKEKEEPKKLDSEHESEGEKKALGQDSAAKIGAIVRAQVEAKFDAIQETARSLGKVRVSAFDSAADVYRAALKAEGVNIKGLAKSECRAAYRALMMGRQSAKRVAAMDSKPYKPDALSKMLNSIRVGE